MVSLDAWGRCPSLLTSFRDCPEINPKGLVPVVEHHNHALNESTVIGEFFEDAFPSHTPHLLPSDAHKRAHVRIWIDHISKNVVPAFFRLVAAQEPEKQKAGLEEVYAALKPLAEQIKGPYFLGEEFSLLDITIAPFVARDYLIADYRGFERGQVSAKWQEYADHVEKRESVVQTMSVSIGVAHTLGYNIND